MYKRQVLCSQICPDDDAFKMIPSYHDQKLRERIHILIRPMHFLPLQDDYHFSCPEYPVYKWLFNQLFYHICVRTSDWYNKLHMYFILNTYMINGQQHILKWDQFFRTYLNLFISKIWIHVISCTYYGKMYVLQLCTPLAILDVGW